MAYIARLTIKYDCSTFQRTRESDWGNIIANTYGEAIAELKRKQADCRESYERAGWHTSDYADGFVGEKNGNRNYYYGYTANEIGADTRITHKAPRLAESTQERISIEDFVKQCKAAGMTLEECKDLAKRTAISWERRE